MTDTWTIVAAAGGQPASATLRFMGGTLTVTREAGGLVSRWVGEVPGISQADALVFVRARRDELEPDQPRRAHWQAEEARIGASSNPVYLRPNPALECRSQLGHLARFAMEPEDYAVVSADLAAELVAHHWLDYPPVRHNAAANPAVLAFENGLITSACWQAPLAIRCHMRQARWHFHHQFKDDPPPPLLFAEQDPI